MNVALLLSGGMDSVALAYWKRPGLAYTIDYGQLAARGETRAATAVCAALGIRHRVLRASCAALGSGDMAGTARLALAPMPEWWPFRNQLLATLAGGAAIADGVKELMFGAIRTDEAHIDGRPEFFERISDLLEMQEGGIRVTAPALAMDAVQLVIASGIPMEILAWSHSCHVAEYACGRCRGCAKHADTMKKLGYGDY